MSESSSAQMPLTKKIIKRRLYHLKKQYLVLQDNLYSWKAQNDDFREEIAQYDQTTKNILSYFPVVFEKKNPHVKLILENKRLKILYNQIEVNQEIKLNKQSRLQIIQELEKTFRPHKQFIYTDEKQKEGIQKILKEKSF